MHTRKIIICLLVALCGSLTAYSQQQLYIFKDGAITQSIPLADIDSMKLAVHYTAVDLGLSVKWATCNVGATSPEAAGDYFAWGETEPKALYTPATCTTHGKKLTASEVSGVAQYDAATANWGGTWRLPTHTELNDLISKCTWTWDNTRKGYTVKGTNGNSIFLPAAGYKSYDKVISAGTVGEYWTATPHEADAGISEQKWAHFLLFYNNKNHSPAGEANHYRTFYYRCDGRTIRPVCP